MKTNSKIIYLFGFLVLAKLFHSILKSDNTIEEPIPNKNNNEKDILDINLISEKPKEFNTQKSLHPSDEFEIMKKGEVLESKTHNNEITEKPKVLGKNSFLYPTDEFGIMKEGKVF